MTSRHNRSASPRFQSIKAVFEQPDAVTSPPPRPFSRGSSPRTPTDETPNPVTNLISRETSRDQQETIDALLEASSNHRWPTSREQLRPKSSWIGPPPPPRLASHSAIATMAQPVTIKYSSPGLQPPVYITTSLSDPQWDLLEMDCTELPSGEREFVKTFLADEGEYQYKFRLGPGDWWVCDEDKPTLDDGLGNRNNVLVVKDQPASAMKKTAAHAQHLADDDAVSNELESGPTFPHERDPLERNPKRDSLGDDVLGTKLVQDSQAEHHTDGHHAPLFAHEQNGSPHRKLDVPPEDRPVDIHADDDDDDGDVEPSHYPQSPIFAHERDIPMRASTPGTDEDEDFMEEAPLMRHETLSPEPSERHHAPRLAHEKDQHNDYDSDVLMSPVSASSAQLPESRNHIPVEADPNDPSLEVLPTHHEGILESLRRSSMRMSKEEAMHDIVTSTSPVTKTMSHASSQSPSLPSVLEDEEEHEDRQHEDDASKPTSEPKAHSLAAGSHTLPGASERPAALMTPPRTPDESKSPVDTAAHSSDHHHKPASEKDMHEEATHDVTHHKSKHEHKRAKSAERLIGMDGDAGPSEESQDGSKPASKREAEIKRTGFFGGLFNSALGIGLTVLVGAGAAWLAFRMHDTIKDGGAALTS